MHRTRRRALIAIASCARGPALRDAPTDNPADGTTGGGGNTDSGSTGSADGQPATGDDWKAKYEALLPQSRKWEGRAKDNATAAEQLTKVTDTFKQLFGLDKPTPEQLTEAATKAQTDAQEANARAAAAEVELFVYKAAGRAGANAEKLLDSRAFCDAVDDLEPVDEADFTKQLGDLIKQHLDKDPSLRAGGQTGGGRMGAVTGGSGGNIEGRPTSIREALARKHAS